MKNNFKNYDTEKIGAILLGLMAIFIGAGFITFSHSLYISVLSVLAINLIAIFVLIYIIILPALDRNYKHIYFIGGDYIQECDINIVSRILMNISKMTGLDAISLFAEKEYLQFNSYVCSGDYDIQYFIDTILKGVSNRHYIQVKCSGHNRQVAIDFCDINKKMCIYITNADGRQFISFRPLTSAQTLGLIDISSKSSESKAIRFNSPVRIHNILTCILIASLIIMTIYLTYNPIRQSEFGVIVFIMLWALAYIA